MKQNPKVKQKKEFSHKELDSFFKELNKGGQTFSPNIVPERRDVTADWVTTSGSSKQSNRLIRVSTWQTGQAY
jgi:hypothetical protein